MFGRKRPEKHDIMDLASPEALEQARQAPVAVLYKHSTLCAASASAIRQVQRFADDHPHVPVYRLDVIRNRHLSQVVEETLGVHHESPQAIVLRNGVPQWSGSHSKVTARALAEQVGEPDEPRGPAREEEDGGTA